MSNFCNLAGKPDKWDQSFQDLSSDNYEFLYGRSKGKRDCISSRKFLQCSFFGELLFCSSQRRRGKSKLKCITVVQWSRSCLNVQINRVRLPSTLFSVSLYRFWSPFFNTIFLFGLFFFILTADPAGHELGSIYILSSSPEFYFGKGISKALDLHTAQAYDQIKAVCSQDMSLLRNSRILVQFVVYCVFVSYDVNEHWFEKLILSHQNNFSLP